MILLTGQDEVDIVKLVIENRVVLEVMFESIVSWTNNKYLVVQSWPSIACINA